jgi:hypothetical protein
LADPTSRDKSDAVARAVSWLLRPLHSLILAAVIASVAAHTSHVALTLTLTLTLFCAPAVLVLGLTRAIGGKGAFSRRRTVPQLLAAYVVALLCTAPLGLPEQAVRAYVVYFALGLVAVLGAKWNISAHGLLAGGAAGLLSGWLPWAAAPALGALGLLAWSRVHLDQHTSPQAIAGATCGAALGLLGALV